ncbi:hypothetical protein DFH07DRAFT_851568 [Mycena maculata]|uniref:Uncharacterized protein n=1 Tax=Mycena maculata TaxID=230809 RepID=A0AAD7MQ56_9AGAR|nr:hypothetical protein DFH07DRAFT_851568 [Mycena maculata]
MQPTDVHFFPPSSSVLVALSDESLTPPSPILSAVGVSCSNDYIPILLDFICLEPSISCSTLTSTFPCVTDPQSDVAGSRGSVGTFGPLHRQSRQNDACWSPNSPAFLGHDLPTGISTSPSSAAPLTAVKDIEVAPTPGSSPTTPTFQSYNGAPISPSPSVSSCPSSPRLRRKFKFPIDCNGPTLPGSKSWVPVFEPRDDNCAPPDGTKNKLALPGYTHPQMSRDVRPSLIRQSPIQCPSSPDKCAHAECSFPIPLPKVLSWLQDTVVELLVDQEGFRSIHPTFKLVGFPKQARGWDSPDQGGLALFRPVKRETFRFHYAPLDGLPILRRLTVNDDESRDYISRQACLSLKANGVYTVQGSESSHIPSSCFDPGDPKTTLTSDHTKFKWEFQYLVEDRLEQSGKIVDGEKTLTPLTFLCSPWLLHPSQARKMKLMHIVKKSVTTKLVAEKLEPPLPFLSGPNPPAKPATLWTLHRRVQSSHGDEPKARKKTGSMRRAEATRTSRDENQEPQFFGRRRRASSAGEGRLVVKSECYPATVHPSTNPVAQHIVPRAELAELLNNNEVERFSYGLSPAPRR